MSIRRCAVAVVVAASATIGGCGGGDRDAIEDMLRQVRATFAAGELAGACRHMSARAKDLVGAMGHAEQTACERDLARVRAWIPARDREETDQLEVGDVTFEGERARALVEEPGKRPYTVRLAEQPGGKWALDGIFDAGRSMKFQEHSDVAPDRGPPPPDNADESDTTPVSATRSSRSERRCPPVRVAGHRVEGGCQVVFPGIATELWVDSVLGRVPLRDCQLGLSLHVDADGRTWTNDFTATGGKVCTDIRPCGWQSQRGPRPWRGRVAQAPDGRLVHRFAEICLDTCVGVYRGAWAMSLERTGTGWLARSQREMVGTTGWVFDAESYSDPTRVELAPSSSP